MSTDTVADRRVHPATVPLRFAKDAPSTLLGLPAAFAFLSKGSWAHVLGVAALVAVVVFLLIWLAWWRFRYGIGARDLVIEQGLLHRTRRSIPFDRIQDIDIERGPLQRLFGLATVRVETGGSDKDEGLIDSVTLAEADSLGAAVRAGRAGAVPVDTAAAAAADAPASRTVYAMGLGRVLVAGLFNFSLVYLAGLFGALQTFRNVLPFDIYDPGRWIGLVDERFGEGALRHMGPDAILAVLLVAVLVGIAFGVARTVAADYGFRLTAEGTRLRRTRGLFTRSEVVLSKARVQLAMLHTGPLRHAAGWGELDFQTLSAATAGGSRQTVAPLANQREIAAILGEQGRLRLPDCGTLVMVSSRHYLRVLATCGILPLVAILAAAAFYRPALLGLALLPVLGATALLERRFHRYGIDGDLFFVTRGVWRQHLWIVPRAHAQTVTLSRSLLQRPLGLATVSVDTAGGSAWGTRVIDLRLERARALVDALAIPAGSPAPTDSARPYHS